MSNSLQPPAKLFIQTFCTIFIILSNTSAFEFGVSPSELNFDGKENQKICKSVSVFSSLNKINISLEDKWAENENANKNINLYSISNEELNLELEYEKNFILNRKKEIDVCLTSKNAGNLKGILIFEALNKSLSIGIWINVNVSKNNKASKITGFSVLNSDNFNVIKIPLVITTFNLFLLLSLIFFYSRRKIKHKKSNN